MGFFGFFILFGPLLLEEFPPVFTSKASRSERVQLIMCIIICKVGSASTSLPPPRLALLVVFPKFTLSVFRNFVVSWWIVSSIVWKMQAEIRKSDWILQRLFPTYQMNSWLISDSFRGNWLDELELPRYILIDTTIRARKSLDFWRRQTLFLAVHCFYPSTYSIYVYYIL